MVEQINKYSRSSTKFAPLWAAKLYNLIMYLGSAYFNAICWDYYRKLTRTEKKRQREDKKKRKLAGRVIIKKEKLQKEKKKEKKEKGKRVARKVQKQDVRGSVNAKL